MNASMIPGALSARPSQLPSTRRPHLSFLPCGAGAQVLDDNQLLCLPHASTLLTGPPHPAQARTCLCAAVDVDKLSFALAL